jgi:hypothetical protein
VQMTEDQPNLKSDNPISEADRDLLRSILKKDNDRIKDEIIGSESEVVFELAFEGGGLEVTRYRTKNGKVYYRTSGTSMRLDDNDDEEWVDWEDEPVTSFDGTLVELRMGINILCITPILVHPDYRSSVRNYVEARLAEVTVDDRKRMGSYLAATADQWFERLDRRRSNEAKSI